MRPASRQSLALTPRSSFSTSPISHSLGVLPSTSCDVLVVNDDVQSDAGAGECETSQTGKELPGCRVAARWRDWASDQVFAIGPEVATTLVSDATAIVAQVPVCRRVGLSESQCSSDLPVDTLAAWNHRRHKAIADECSVVGERSIDASNVGRAVSSSMTSDPEVVTSSLNGLVVPWLIWIAGSKSVRSTSLSWVLDQRGPVAAASDQYRRQI